MRDRRPLLHAFSTRPFTIVLAVCLLLLLGSAHGKFDLTLLHTANTYSAVGAVDVNGVSCSPANGTYLSSSGTPTCYGGVARMMTLINEQRARSPNTLLVDAGDIIATSLYFYVYGPSLVGSYYAELGYDLVHLQVPDFNQLIETTVEFIEVATAADPVMQFVVSNLEGFNNDSRANGTFIAKWAFKTFPGGEMVGYAATLDPNLASMIRDPGNIGATREAKALLVAVMTLMNMGANKIVASVSSNATAELVLDAVPGIDILIVPSQLQSNDLNGSIRSSAVGPYPLVHDTAWAQPVLVVSSGKYGQLMGVLDVEFDDNGVLTGWSGDSVLLDNSVAADPEVQARLAANYAEMQANFSIIAGWSAVDLAFQTQCIFSECTIGDWAVDSLRAFAMHAWGGNVQIGLINGGSMNTALPSGPITLGMQQTAFPFGSNLIYTFQLQGSDILSALENSLSLATDVDPDYAAAGKFLQVSGLTYSWNPGEVVGYRVVDVYVEVTPGVWSLLDLDAVYNVSTIDWLVIDGGNGYTMIQANAMRLLKNGYNINAVILGTLAKNVTSVDTGRVSTSTATRRTCLAGDGSVCHDNGYCLTGVCQCVAAGTFSRSLCASPNSTLAASNSRATELAIALGVSLPLATLVLLVLAVLAVLVVRRRRYRNSWEIDMDELEMGDLLGVGGYGEVYLAVWKGTDVAVKVLPSSNAGKTAWDSFKREVSVMTDLRHPNVVLFMAASIKPPRMCIVMELMELGSLYDLIHNDLVPTLPLLLCLKMAYQAAKGMHFLHSSGVVHRDLKSLNLLLDSKWNLKVSDFGLTKFRADLKRASGDIVHGTIHWTAPEVLDDQLEVDYAPADVYSFGVVMWELITREQPYRGLTAAAIAVGVIRDALRPTDLNVDVKQRHPEFEAIMAECWHQDATARPSFLEVMSRLSALSSASEIADGRHLATVTDDGAQRAESHDTASSSVSGQSRDAESEATQLAALHVGFQAAPAAAEAVTVVFTDVVHAERLWNAEPHAMCEAVMLHNKLLRRVARRHCGYESAFLRSGNARGEGYFCFVFARPIAALRCCEQIQRELAEVDWENIRVRTKYPGEEIAVAADSVLFHGLRVRMGVHHGTASRFHDPLSNRYQYHGNAVRVATELMIRADGGHVLVSDAVVAAVEAWHAAGGSPGRRKGKGLTSAHSRQQQFTKIGVLELPPADNSGGSLLKVEVLDLRLAGPAMQTCQQRCWEDANSGAQRSTAVPPGGPDTVSSGGSMMGETDVVSSSWVPSSSSGDESSFIGSSDRCRWIIPFEKLVIQDGYVGQGNYGFVSQGRWKGIDVAVKRFINQRLEEDTMLRFREEAALLAELRHPNVVLFVGACVRSPNVGIVTEWIPNGSLSGLVADKSISLPWPRRMAIVKGIAQGLAYLHSRRPVPILHQDLKSSNVLIDESWNAKISDFGLAHMKQVNATRTRCGTPAWIAPEVVLRASYTEKADIYSLGIVMWEVATRKLPFAGENLARVAVDIVEGKRPPVPPNELPEPFEDLMVACWHQKPDERPSAEQVCQIIDTWMPRAHCTTGLGDASV